MSNRLQEKVVIVTGAAQGIGFGCARLLAAEGAAVVLGDIQKERGEQSAAIIRKEGGEALFCPADVREEQQCAALIEKAVQSYGKLNGLVNNAGWFPRATLEETTTELWEQILQVNLRSAFYYCKHAVPRMREAKGGSIVNIGSICGIQSLPNIVAYGAAKGGLLSLTRTLAGALSDDRIRVNYVIPGWVLSEGELKIQGDRKSTRLNSSHSQISYAVFCLKKKNQDIYRHQLGQLPAKAPPSLPVPTLGRTDEARDEVHTGALRDPGATSTAHAARPDRDSL